jgi:head-tail adaptor
MKCGGCSEMPQRCTHTLTVERLTTTAEASGQIDPNDDDNWSSIGQIRVRFITRGGDEQYLYKQIHATTTTIMKGPRTTLSASLDPSYRLRLGTRIIHIVAAYVINETGKEVQIEGEERRQP